MLKTHVSRVAAGAIISAALMAGSLSLTATAASACTEPACVKAEPVKLNETSGGWFCLCGLLGLDGGAGLVDPGLSGQLGRDRVPSAEPVRTGCAGSVEDLLAAGPDGLGGAVVD